MRLLLLATLALPILATTACSNLIEPVGTPQFYRNSSGSEVRVSYESAAHSLVFNKNAERLITAVVVDELADIGFSRVSSPTVSNGRLPPKISCKITITFDERLALKNNVLCLKDGDAMRSTGAVFRFVELMVEDSKS